MYTIGEFAAFGRVSVRMLRHYDAIGLLPPASVDPYSGYRRYAVAQLPQLLQIVELRELGIGLEAIATALSSSDADTVRDVLVARRDELTASVASDIDRLRRIDRRLSLFEGTAMRTPVSYRPVDAVTVYAVSAVAPGSGPDNVGPLIGPLIGGLDDALDAAGRELVEPGIFWYDPVLGSDDLAVHVSYTAEAPPVPGAGYQVVTLPAVPTMATRIHRGDLTGIGASWSALMRDVVDDGYRPVGACREVYLHADGHEPGPDWVTELQIPVERSAGEIIDADHPAGAMS